MSDTWVAAESAWNRAWKEGYVQESVCRHASNDFWATAGGAVIGLAGGLAGVVIGQTTGAAIGGGLAAYVSGGNPAAAQAGAQLGAAIGRAVVIGALHVFGVYFLYEYLKDRLEYIVPNAVCAYDLIVNQAWCFSGESYDFVIDLAARQLAEVIGVICGLILAALVIYATHRMVTRKTDPNGLNLAELAESKLNKLSDGFIRWLVPRLSSLRQRPVGPPKLAVIEGGLPSGSMTPLQAAIKTARSALSKTVDAASGKMSVDGVKSLDRTLTNEGFELIAVEEWGPKGGLQLFYRKGNVLLRFKTMGDARGPRANQAHMSVAYNDGRGLAWQNDMAKFNANGKVMTKVVTDAKNAQASNLDFQGNPRRFELIPQTFQMSAVDAWADSVHFNARSAFSMEGLEGIVGRAPVSPKGWTMPKPKMPTTGVILPMEPRPPKGRGR